MSVRVRLDLRHVILFAMFGAMMLAGKLVFEGIRNVHLVGMLIVTFTVVYRKYALFPIYVFVLLAGLYYGFQQWWLSYLYIWTVLWGMTMLLPTHTPRFLQNRLSARAKKLCQAGMYCLVCGLHGLLFGTLYAPLWAWIAHLSWKGTLTWIAAGLPSDVIHCLSNLAMGTLIWPLAGLLGRLERGLTRRETNP